MHRVYLLDRLERLPRSDEECGFTSIAAVLRCAWALSAWHGVVPHLLTQINALGLVHVVHVGAEKDAVDELLHALLPHGNLCLGRAQLRLQIEHLLLKRADVGRRRCENSTRCAGRTARRAAVAGRAVGRGRLHGAGPVRGGDGGAGAARRR